MFKYCTSALNRVAVDVRRNAGTNSEFRSLVVLLLFLFGVQPFSLQAMNVAVT